ncbi:MAG TPA: hypothetical protein PLB01_09210 [Thermoanaerobaculia bacterium]|nr:hypothetical protein [Thermoanaerobaculia bacterium]
MKTTRAQFLTTLATGVAAAALGPSSLLGAGPDVPDGRAFKALVGETFRFRGFERRDPVDLVLTDYSERALRGSTRQFTLTLVAPGGERLREATYTVDHPKAGTFEMFVIPAGFDAKAQPLYRADFNLLVAVSGAPTTVQRR